MILIETQIIHCSVGTCWYSTIQKQQQPNGYNHRLHYPYADTEA